MYGILLIGVTRTEEQEKRMRTTVWKSKKLRHRWWNSLTPEEQEKQIEKWQEKKAGKRKAKSLEIMSRTKHKYNCDGCFHRKTHSCTDDMPNGCEYWFDPNGEIVGCAYDSDERRLKK